MKLQRAQFFYFLLFRNKAKKTTLIENEKSTLKVV
jgi:hypothetical protein